MILIMPEHLSVERRQTMRAFGAEIVLTPQKGGMEGARDLAERMVKEGKGTMLDQFANPDNPRIHYETTGPEIWRDTEGKITHFVSSMGTTGTIMGCSRFFKEKNPKIEIIGCQPQEGSQIPGIRKWPEAYLPKIYDKARVDRLEYVSQGEAEEMTRRLAREEGIFAGISSGGAMHVALRVAEGAEERGDRHHRLRPRRSLPDDRAFSRTDDARSSPSTSRRCPDVAGIRKLFDLPADLPDAEVAEVAFQKRRVADRQRLPAAAPAARGGRSPACCATTRACACSRSASQTPARRRRSSASSTASTSTCRRSSRGTAAASTCRCWSRAA